MLGKNIASVLNYLVPNLAWMVRPSLDIASTQVRDPRVKYFLELNMKAPSSMRKRMSTDAVASCSQPKLISHSFLTCIVRGI